MHTHSERGSNALTLNSFASIAQLVEQRIENPRVPGSIPGRGTTYNEALIINDRGFFIFSNVILVGRSGTQIGVAMTLYHLWAAFLLLLILSTMHSL